MPVVSVGTTLHILTHILKIIKINLKTEARHGDACYNSGTGDRRQRQEDCHNSEPVCFLHGKFQPARNNSMTLF